MLTQTAHDATRKVTCAVRQPLHISHHVCRLNYTAAQLGAECLTEFRSWLKRVQHPGPKIGMSPGSDAGLGFTTALFAVIEH